MDINELKEMVEEAAKELPAVAGVNLSKDHEDVIAVDVHDYRPDKEDNPWKLFVMYNNSWEHAVLDKTQACIEVLVPLGRLDPSSDSYINEISMTSLPFVDHQRLFPGPAFSWNPEDGSLRIYGHVFDCGQSKESLAAELDRILVNCIGLLYYATVKKWEMAVVNSLGKMAEPIVLQVRNKMNSLLGLTADKESDEDSIE